MVHSRIAVSHHVLFVGCVIVAMIAASVTALAPLGAQNPVLAPIEDRGVTVDLVPFATIPDSSAGRPRINAFATTGDRLFVVEEFDGKIYEIDRTVNGGSPRLFFDVRAGLLDQTGRRIDNTSRVQGGLRSVAFHPEFETNGLFYTSLMEQRTGGIPDSAYLSDVSNPIVADGVVLEWQVDLQTGQVDVDSYRQLFRVGVPVYDHTMKQIAFNPFAEPGDEDYGLLYVAHGDGSTQAATSGGGLNNDARGKILRIDPRPAGGQPYSVPATNPFVGDPSMLDEVYSLGHRNPHHLAFAQDSTGSVLLISAEAGRENVEEVNVINPGENYGWSQREGTFVHLPGGGLGTGVAALPANEAENGFTFPSAQYGHTGPRGQGFSGQSVAGGFVTDNGSELDGQYFYADFPVSGALYHSTVDELASAVTLLDASNPDRDSPNDLTQAPTGRVSITFDHDANPATPSLSRSHLRDVFDDSPAYDGTGRADPRFGQGPDGELYISSKRNGQIYLVTNSVPSNSLCRGRLATVSGTTGTDGPDVIIGTGGVDRIDAGAGSDIICARGGADTIDAGSGADYVNAGWGSDVIRGGDGNDLIFAGPGLDDVEGENGNDVIRGGRGGDRIVGNGGDDTLFGGDRKDRVFGFAGNDTIFGGTGDDNLRGGPGIDDATGGPGTDQCVDVESSLGCESN